MSKSILMPKRLVLRSLELPLTPSLASAFRDLPSVVCRRIQGTGGAGDELDDAAILTILADEWQRNGRGMADKRRPKLCSQALKRWPTAAVNTAKLWTRLRTSDDGEIQQFSPVFFSNDGRVVVVYICHRFDPIRQRSAADKSLRRGSFLFSLAIHSLPSSTLNQTPMLAPSRTTTEQRFHMDAVELGNDSGPPKWTLFPPARGDLSAGWTLDQHWTGSSSGQANGRRREGGR